MSSTIATTVDEELGTETSCCCTAALAALRQPVEVNELDSLIGYAGESAFWVWPFFGPLLFENTNSDVRVLFGFFFPFFSYVPPYM